ncbi:hypothetical protein M0R45_005935 [Rubus argutus]|uniref:TIR domain-containing protein n=1 Tax=Rubus argutus TaxID=59490 RepID=A0AAW1YPG2_RUBAR
MASSSAVLPKVKYDVFLSFRGEDTRNSFTSHLYAALNRMRIDVYVDYRLENGDDIARALLTAIEQSNCAVIIFSKNYASSRWCLDELVHILRCKEIYGQFVIPIFYGIDPADVRKQKGSYEAIFARHDQGPFKDMVPMWRSALTSATNLSGFDSQSVRSESELVEEVVQHILKILNRGLSSNLEGLVGIESRMKQIESLLCIDAQDVGIRTVGIWGMGGIGKTTLAQAVFDKLSSQFEACCFLPNVRETSATKGGISPQLYNLRDMLLRKLLGERNVPNQTTPTIERFVKERLQRTKVLVVLDDIDDCSQLEFLVGDQVSFGSGSRIIITTRDKRQLIEMEVLRKGADHDVKIYEVEELNGDEARQLFHVNAPRDICSAADSKEFLIKVIDYAAGNPLALKIWRSLFFRCKRKEDLEDLWNKLTKFPHKHLQDLCRISYEALEENEREIFLDMVCFHKGNKIVDVKRELDACGFFSNIGIEILIDMSLISIKDEHLWIHNVIQEFGWDIVQKECPEEPGKRTRLYTPADICHVLEEATGTATVESISLDMANIGVLKLSPQALKNMHNLRFLKFCNLLSEECNVRILDDLESLPGALRYLCWPKYCMKSFPSKFSPYNLVELHMRNSKLQRLWNKDQNPRNLKWIDLSYSKELVEVPDISESRNIESINLQGCTALVEVPSYFQPLHNLKSLNLKNCSSLGTLSEMPQNMEFLDLGWTAVEGLPSSIWSLENLVKLNLNSCRCIKNLPDSTWNLNSLTSLDLARTGIEGLPSSIECLSEVVSIKLKDCRSLLSLPTSICKLKSIKKLSLSRCYNFEHFPEILEPMECLEFLCLSHTRIKELPSSIENLVGLKTLELSGCRSLEFIPSSIYNLTLLEKLKLDGCGKLKALPFVRNASILYGWQNRR